MQVSSTLYRVRIAFLVFTSVGMVRCGNVHCSYETGLYSDSIEVKIGVNLGSVWRLIAVKRRRGCPLALKSTQQLLARK